MQIIQKKLSNIPISSRPVQQPFSFHFIYFIKKSKKKVFAYLITLLAIPSIFSVAILSLNKLHGNSCDMEMEFGMSNDAM
jgi:hypothetical protein